jgi:hypothetical protein
MYYPNCTGKQSEKTLLECYAVFRGKDLPTCRRSTVPLPSSSSTACLWRWIFSAYQSTGHKMSKVLKNFHFESSLKTFYGNKHHLQWPTILESASLFWQKLRGQSEVSVSPDSFAIIMTGAWGTQKVCEWRRICLTLHFEESACFGNTWRDWNPPAHRTCCCTSTCLLLLAILARGCDVLCSGTLSFVVLNTFQISTLTQTETK